MFSICSSGVPTYFMNSAIASPLRPAAEQLCQFLDVFPPCQPCLTRIIARCLVHGKLLNLLTELYGRLKGKIAPEEWP